jgi:hypothetical protein
MMRETGGKHKGNCAKTPKPLISTDLAERRMMMLANRAGDAQ